MTDTTNLSPWIDELRSNRTNQKLDSDMNTHVVIVGGGIAGMATAFFTLENTGNDVILVDAWKIGHGATGHNAGQVVDYFEKPFFEIAEEYGLKMAAEGQASVTAAWKLLDHILAVTKMDITFSKFTGYAGCTDAVQLYDHLENKRLKAKAGLPTDKAKVSNEFLRDNYIAAIYEDMYEIVSQSTIFDLLETNNPDYIAVLESEEGCMNSALFVENVANYLLRTYPEKFQIFENSPVSTVELYSDHAKLLIGEHVLTCERVVLCTNGFENLDITNYSGDAINKYFHDNIGGRVGFMAAYVEEKNRDPKAISYFNKKEFTPYEGPYYYLTRRNHKYNEEDKSLVCIGGPETREKGNSFKYDHSAEYPEIVAENAQKFLDSSFAHTPENNKFAYKWHGLMGYTRSGIRCVGVEPINEVLLYNLGCNGVGILPSLFGGKKISNHLAGNPIPESIFDPLVQRRVHAY